MSPQTTDQAVVACDMTNPRDRRDDDDDEDEDERRRATSDVRCM